MNPLKSVLIGSATLGLGVSAALAELPATKLFSASPVSPATAWDYYASLPNANARTNSNAAWSTRPAEIKEIARGLGAGRYSANDYANTVYEFVRNNFQVDFRFGLSKGARGVLVDQSGTAFDQTHLMVELLREGGVPASYQVGTVTLDGTQIYDWTGYQNAVAACQFLADGGIPAIVNNQTSCGSLSGNVTSVTLGHIWVVANGKLYDVAYKKHKISSGMDLSAAAGCGISAASTCGTTVLGSIPATVTGAGGTSYVQGSATVQNNVNGALQNFGVGLENWIKSYNATNRTVLQTQDLVGGMSIDVQAPPSASATLPYPSSAQYTWSGEIPDPFRTTLRVQLDNLDQVVFADEIAGGRLRIWGGRGAAPADPNTATRTIGLYYEYRPLAKSTLTAGRDATLTLTVGHPYAAAGGTYADELLVQPIRGFFMINECDLGSGCSGGTFGHWLLNTLTIVHGWGSTKQSAIAHFSALKERDRISVTPENPTDPNHVWAYKYDYDDGFIYCITPDIAPPGEPNTVPTSSVVDPGCFEQHQPVVAANWLAETSRFNELAGEVGKGRVQHHHSLGWVLSGQALGGFTIASLESALSVNSKSANANDRRAIFAVASAGMSRIEGGVFQQMFDGFEGGASISFMARSIAKGQRIYELTGSNANASFAAMSNYSTAKRAIMESYITSGYTLVAPQNGYLGTYTSGGSSITYNYNGYAAYTSAGDRVAYLMRDQEKGAGGAPAPNPLNATLNSTKMQEHSLKQSKYYGVNMQSGVLTLSPPPDLVTGVGSFPLSLPFQRFYNSGTKLDVPSICGPTELYCGYYWQDTPTFDLVPLGGGWTSNFAITAIGGSDAFLGMGRESALHAAGAIAALVALRDLNAATANLRSNVATILATDWLTNRFWQNIVTVQRPPSNSVFVRMLDGTTFSPAGGSERLTQTGARTVFGWSGSGTGWNYNGMAFSLRGADGSTLSFINGVSEFGGGNLFVPSSWQFPDGTNLSFSYADYAETVPSGTYKITNNRCLRSVSNNLGRSLTFSCDGLFNFGFYDREFRIQTNWVQDETGRQVQFRSNDNTYNDSFYRPPQKWTVVAPDGTTTRYDYVQRTNTPLERNSLAIYQWFTPDDLTTPFNTVEYDSLYRVKGLLNKVGGRTAYFISGLYADQPATRGESQDAIGALVTRYFDRRANIVSEIDPLGRSTYKSYDPVGRITRTVLPEQDSVEYAYDARGNLLTTTRKPKPGSAWAPMTTTKTYVEGPTVVDCANPARCNKIDSSTDYKGRVSSFSYNSMGQITQIRGPTISSVRAESDFCYDTLGGISFLTGKVDVVGGGKPTRVIKFAYDAGNKYVLSNARLDPPDSLTTSCAAATRAGAKNITTAFTFDGLGNVRTIDGARSDVTDVSTFTFDTLRRLTQVDAPMNQRTVYTYFDDGLLRYTDRIELIGGTPVSRREERGYFPTGELQSIRDPNGSVTTFAYDPVGRRTLATDPDNRRSATVYDLAGQTTCTFSGWDTAVPPTSANCSSWNPAAYAAAGYEGPIRYSAFEYAPNGKQIKITDANNNSTDMAYDAFDRLRYILFPAPTGATAGQRCSAPTSETITPSPTCPTGATYEELRYSSNGNPAASSSGLCGGKDQVCRKRTRSNQTVTYTYDTMNRVATKVASGLPTETYAYNLMNEILSVSSPASGAIPAHRVAYDYDDAGQKLYEENTLNGVVRRVSFDYDSAANRTAAIWPDGYRVSYEFDAANRMSRAWEGAIATGVTLADYSYDTLSRRSGLQFANSSSNRVGYTYEPDSKLDVLTHVLNSANLTLDHDRNNSGQITDIIASDGFYLPSPASSVTTSYVADKLNRYASVGGQAATYDSRGNLLSWYQNNVLQTYTYDSENRLRTAATDGTTTPSITYDYDALGRRLSKTVSGVGTYFLLDGDKEIGEYNSAGTVLRRYISGPVKDDRIARVEGAAVTGAPKYFYHVNHQGSTLATTDSGGSIAQQLAYDEYGNLTSQQPPASVLGEQYRYTGRRFDSETGLYYYRARYYSPQLGRFLQVDPIGYKDDLNLYAYVGNNPANATDPTGTKCATDSAGTGACTVDKFEDKQGNEITREEATKSDPNWLVRLFTGDNGARIRNLERKMTEKYEKAKGLAARGGSVTIKGDRDLGIPAQTVTGEKIVASMEATEVTAAASKSPNVDNAAATTSKFMTNEGVVTKPATITFWRNGSGGDLQNTFGHEILHTVYSGVGVPNLGWDDLSRGQEAHQEPFDEAAKDIR